MFQEPETTYLTSDMNFLTGMASTLCLGGNFYRFNFSSSERASDARAINNDWRMVGRDMARAMNAFKEKELAGKS